MARHSPFMETHMEQGQAPSSNATALPAAPAPEAPVKRTLSDFSKALVATMDAEAGNPQEGFVEEPQAPVLETPPPPPEVAETAEATEEQAEEVEETNPEPVEEVEEVDYEGKLYRVPKELKSALLRQSDYTRKAQEVAEGRKQVELLVAHAQQAVQAAQQFGDVLGQIKQADAAIEQFHRLDWNGLRESDPVEYATRQADYTRWQLHRQTLTNSLQEAHGKVSQAQALQLQAKLQQAIPVLKEKIPGWGESKQREIRSYAGNYGYSDEELDGLIDPRAVLVLHDAMEYRKSQARKVEAVKKAKTLPPVAKPSARPQAEEAKAAFQKTREQFRRGGGKDLDQLAGLLKHRLSRS